MQFSRNHKLSFTIHPHPQHPGPQGCPKNAKRTHFQPGDFAKRTQFTVPLASRRLSDPKKCKTNPIYRPHFAKRTQFTPNSLCINSLGKIADSYLFQNHLRTPATPNAQNEPNLSRGGLVEVQKCKTNPITMYRWRLAGFPITKNTKRTQFAPTVTLHHPKNAKRTQITVSPAFPSSCQRGRGFGLCMGLFTIDY